MRVIRVILFLASVFLFLVACTPKKIPSNSDPAADIKHWAFKTGVPLLTGLGDYRHSVTTDNPVTQRYFDQGLVMSFAFNHSESIRAFRAARMLDERCAMCYWGEALALGPNINVTRNGQVVMEEAAHRQAYTAIQKAISLNAQVSEKERDYIDALAVRYSNDASIPRSDLDEAYLQAMRHLFQKYPEDDDVAALYAESMMNTMPWNYWVNPETPKALTVEVIDVLETVLQRSPRHPLAIHLYIHAVEASSKPERAERAADTLRDLVPGAGHLVHMPSHIYWRVGRYGDASEANFKAAAIDEAYIAACHTPGFYAAAYYPHNLHFLWAAYSMEGRSRAAIETAQRVAASVSLEMIEHYPAVEFFKTIPLLAFTNFGRWHDVLMQPPPPAHLEFSNGVWRYARAIAHAKLGDLDAARTEYSALASIRETANLALLDVKDYPATLLLQIADQLVQGEVFMAQRDYAKAITAFKAAVVSQNQLPYTEPPFWYYPTQLSLGKALLESGDYVQAETVYLDNLKHYPQNGWALYGLIQSLQAQDKDFSQVQEEFDRAWQHADVHLTASRF
jgi:tetratricopeptide (TPR) repeat protein